VVGYDHGGGIAIALGFDAPDRVERLALRQYAPPGFGYGFGLQASP
jgi:pimeloyl-ACP methyl ester carboxylesterase